MSEGMQTAGTAARAVVSEGKLMPVDSLQKQEGGSYDGRGGRAEGTAMGSSLAVATDQLRPEVSKPALWLTLRPLVRTRATTWERICC